jgi:hypothetical protein
MGISVPGKTSTLQFIPAQIAIATPFKVSRAVARGNPGLSQVDIVNRATTACV